MESRPCMRRLVQFENEVPVLFEEENMMLTKQVDFTFDPETPTTSGTLYITSRRVIWASENQAYDFDVPYIILHAITHDPASFPRPCLYCQFDIEDCGDFNEDDDTPTEMYLVPASEGDLQEMFDSFSQAAVLNPDPDYEEDDDMGLIYNAEEVQLGAEQAARLDHLESVFRLPGEEPVSDDNAGQYEDAADEEEDEVVEVDKEGDDGDMQE